MGTYATQSDLESVFGTVNIAKWSQLDATTDNTTADTVRIAAAIAYAESEINDRFRTSRYQVPLVANSTVPRSLVHWVCVGAGLWLYRSKNMDASSDQASTYESMELRVNDEINSYLSGQRELDCVSKSNGGSRMTAAPTVFM